MAIKRLTFDLAIGALDGYMQKKTTHATKDILVAMQSLASAEFVTAEDKEDFSNICSNFDKYVTATGKTSIGRKQFEEWWEMSETLVEVIDEPTTQDKMLETYHEQEDGDGLPDAFNDPVEPEDSYLTMSREDLISENIRLKDAMKKMFQEKLAIRDLMKRKRAIDKELAEWD